MPDRTLSFNAQMVEAILARVKTQTRRLGEKPPAAEGDVIRVREAHFLGPVDGWDAPHTISPDDPAVACYYRAGWNGPAPGRWRRSLYMPRWATRIFLAVTKVREEQLRDITEEDARREGVSPGESGSAVEAFAALWDSIYAERGGGWQADPRVWRVEFRLAKRPDGSGRAGQESPGG
jgi:hypothetical protein